MQNTLLGKIIAEKPLNSRGVKNILQSLWPKADKTEIAQMGMNLYVISFTEEAAMAAALANGPWSVMGHCLNLKKWEMEKTVNEVNFTKVYFWVQIHNLPLEMMSEQML